MLAKLLVIATVGLIIAGVYGERYMPNSPVRQKTDEASATITPVPEIMAIPVLRSRDYSGSRINIEQTLPKGINYSRYIASYISEGNKIYGLLTVPNGQKPDNGWPIVAFLHGYIDPKIYRTTERYVAYQDGLARNGFITFKIDYRGHGQSEGMPVNAHFSEGYVVDTLNAIASLKKLPEADPTKIGVWGHSNGGEIGLRVMAIDKEIKAGVFWAGVVGSAKGMLQDYNSKIPFLNLTKRQPDFVKEHGLPSANPQLWNQIDPYNYLKEIGAVQLHHGTGDKSVPIETSRELRDKLQNLNKPVEYFEYPGADHNLSGAAFTPAMQRTVDFFRKYLAGI